MVQVVTLSTFQLKVVEIPGPMNAGVAVKAPAPMVGGGQEESGGGVASQELLVILPATVIAVV